MGQDIWDFAEREGVCRRTSDLRCVARGTDARVVSRDVDSGTTETGDVGGGAAAAGDGAQGAGFLDWVSKRPPKTRGGLSWPREEEGARTAHTGRPVEF